jgi:hypothetical protein
MNGEVFRAALINLGLEAVCSALNSNSSLRALYEQWTAFASSQYFALAMNLSWISALNEGAEASAVIRFQASLKDRSFQFVFDYVTYLDQYLKDKNLDNLINTRNLHQILNAKTADESKHLNTLVNFCWTFNHETFMSVLTEQMSLLPNTPFMVTCKDEKIDQTITIVFDGQDYKVFSPYEPQFVDSKPEMAKLTHTQLRESILEHFYSKDTSGVRIFAVSNYVKASFEPSILTRILTKQYFQEYLLQIASHNGIDPHEKILNTIRDGKIKGVLNLFYSDIPEPMIQLYLQTAVIKQDWDTTIEIILCATETQQKHELMRLVLETFYQSAYRSKHDLFLEIRETFNNSSIDFDAYVSAEDKLNPHWLTPSIKTIGTQLDFAHKFMDFGFVFTPEQRAALAFEFAYNPNGQYFHWGDKSKNQYMKNLIPLLERMLQAGYQFMQKDGLSSFQYLHWLIDGYWCIDAHRSVDTETNPEKKALYQEQLQCHQHLVEVLKGGIQTGAFNLNVKDSSGKTLLNNCTSLKQWEMVKFLYTAGATYSIDKSWSSVPPLRARLEEVESLRFTYDSFTEADWLALKTSHHNILCACLNHENPPLLFLNHWLDYFKDEIQTNIIPYLTSCQRDPQKMDRVLSVSGLREKNTPIETIKPEPISIEGLYTKYIKKIEINPRNAQADYELPENLSGLSMMELAQKLSDHHQTSVDIFSSDKTKFYVSWNSTLTDALKFLMLPYLDSKYHDELTLLEKNPNGVVDLPKMFDNLAVLDKTYQEGYQQWKSAINSEEYFDRKRLYSKLALPYSESPLGLVLICDSQGMIEKFEILKSLVSLLELNNYVTYDAVRPMMYLGESSCFYSATYFALRYPLYQVLATKTPLRFSTMEKEFKLAGYNERSVREGLELYKGLL